jgi:hypothetical protein
MLVNYYNFFKVVHAMKYLLLIDVELLHCISLVSLNYEDILIGIGDMNCNVAVERTK